MIGLPCWTCYLITISCRANAVSTGCIYIRPTSPPQISIWSYNIISENQNTGEYSLIASINLSNPRTSKASPYTGDPHCAPRARDYTDPNWRGVASLCIGVELTLESFMISSSFCLPTSMAWPNFAFSFTTLQPGSHFGVNRRRGGKEFTTTNHLH